MDEQKDSSLFILLGLDTLFSLEISNLLRSDLRIVFSHATHKQPDGSEDYPLGMGLFVKDSEFHFFGGENMEDAKDPNIEDEDEEEEVQAIDFSVRLRTTRGNYPMQDDPVFGFLYKRPKYQANWKNNKVFSFVSNKDRPLFRDYTTPLPQTLGYKVRPIVVTISKKVYALGTRPFRPNIGSLELKPEENQILFEVFEPIEDGQWQGKWQWRRLTNPPDPLRSSILLCDYRRSIYHSVIKDKLFLQTERAEYIFDTISETWIYNNYEGNVLGFDDFDLSGMILHNFTPCNYIFASLEYKDHLLVFVDYKLVAYDLSLFKDFKGAKDSLDGSFKTILDVGYMVDNRPSIIAAASLTLVGHNRICFVFSTCIKLHVCLLEFTEPPCVKVIAKKVFDLPRVLLNDTTILSTYFCPHDDEKILRRNQQLRMFKVLREQSGLKVEGFKVQ